jgi:hypothetical protein
MSNDLIIKSFAIGYWISALCLIIKGRDNQAQKLKYQINQYPKKGLIVNLDGSSKCSRFIHAHVLEVDKGLDSGLHALCCQQRADRRCVATCAASQSCLPIMASPLCSMSSVLACFFFFHEMVKEPAAAISSSRERQRERHHLFVNYSTALVSSEALTVMTLPAQSTLSLWKHMPIVHQLPPLQMPHHLCDKGSRYGCVRSFFIGNLTFQKHVKAYAFTIVAPGKGQ